MSSAAAMRPIPGSNVYCIAKAGLEMLVRAIHSESQYILDKDITCIGFRPGVIDTEMQTLLRSFSEDELPVVKYYKEFHAKGGFEATARCKRDNIQGTHI